MKTTVHKFGPPTPGGLHIARPMLNWERQDADEILWAHFNQEQTMHNNRLTDTEAEWKAWCDEVEEREAAIQEGQAYERRARLAQQIMNGHAQRHAKPPSTIPGAYLTLMGLVCTAIGWLVGGWAGATVVAGCAAWLWLMDRRVS